jgi:ABC-type glycerol-3-phosphate transport system substrate-binding protein
MRKMMKETPALDHGDPIAQRLSRRRFITATASATTSAVLLAACEGSSRSGGTASNLTLSTGPVTVTPFISAITDAMLGQWQSEIVAPYQQRRPNVKVELVPALGPTIQRIEKIRTMIAAGSPPDLSEGPEHTTVMNEQGLLDPALDALIKRDKYDVKKFNQAHFQEGMVQDGKVWRLPNRYGGNAVGLACNKTLFAESGVELPAGDVSRAWTWEQFVNALTRLTKKDGSGQITQFGLAGPAWMIGTWPPLWRTDWLSSDMKSVICDNPQMRDCYSKLGDLFARHHVVPQPGEASRLFGNANLFNTGKAAIILFPPTGWITYGRNAQVDYVIAPLPKVAASTPDMGMGGISLIKGGQSPADAWDFLKYLLEGSRLAKFTNLMPAEMADIEPWVRDQLKNVPSADAKAVLKIVEQASGNSVIARHNKFTEMLDVINPALNDLMTGKVAAPQMLQTVKPQLQVIIGEKA